MLQHDVPVGALGGGGGLPAAASSTAAIALLLAAQLRLAVAPQQPQEGAEGVAAEQRARLRLLHAQEERRQARQPGAPRHRETDHQEVGVSS